MASDYTIEVLESHVLTGNDRGAAAIAQGQNVLECTCRILDKDGAELGKFAVAGYEDDAGREKMIKARCKYLLKAWKKDGKTEPTHPSGMKTSFGLSKADLDKADEPV